MTQPEFKLQLRNGFSISDLTAQDVPALVEHLQERQIFLQTLNIPSPYTKADAEKWLARVAEETEKQGRSVNWAIRGTDGSLIGGIGFHGIELGKSHKAEIGYWLAKPFWNQGIMTEAARGVTDFGFKSLGLTRITANVFVFNIGSCRVLEKIGYQLEGTLRQHYQKEGKLFDGKLYAKLKTD